MATHEQHGINVSTTTILKVVIVVLLLWFLFLIRDIIAMVFISFVIASALDPWVDWLQERRIPRVASVTVLAIIILGLMSLLVVLVVPPLVEEIRLLTARLPELYAALARYFYLAQGADQTALQALERNLQSFSQGLLQLTSGVFGAISTVFGGMAAFLTVMVISFYMIVEEHGFRKVIQSVAPARFQPYLAQLLQRIQRKMGSWFRGQLLLSAIDGTVTFIGLSVLQVRFALLFALLTAFLRIIPYIGPVLAAIPAILVAASESLVLAAIVLGFYLVYNQIVDNFIQPKVMQQTVGLHPIIILVLLLIGARVGGILGTILAVPLGTILAIFLQDFFEERRTRENQLEDAQAR